MPVILITDAFYFVLILLLIAYCVHIYRNPYLAETWGKLMRSRSATVAMIVLLLYFLIALVDSMHYRPLVSHNNDKPIYSSQVISVLDLWIKPLKERSEITYSAPLATHAYIKDIVEQADGALIQEYPRLKYGGAHLSLEQIADPWAKTYNIIIITLYYAALASVLISLLLLGICLWLAYRTRATLREILSHLLKGDTETPWRAMALTVLALTTTIFILAGLSADYHVLGTDKIGEDVLYQAVKSIRTGVLIGTLTTFVMLPFALMLGISAGYFLGWIDDVIQYLYTTLNSIPGVLLIAAAVLMLYLYMDQNPAEFADITTRSDTRLFFLCMILGITSWTGLCRLLRAETLKIKEIDYIDSARVLGASHLRVILRHITPNIMHIVFITIALDFSGLVLAEVVLSYVDIGVDPAMNSWGNMINSARLELAREPVVWWPLSSAILFLFVLVLCANLFADGVRDAFDPNVQLVRN